MKIKREHKNHNFSGTKLYNSWRGMKQRCYDKSQFTKGYQGKGITVCDEWHKFVLFKEWAMKNGYQDGLTIDRINNDSSYEPKNCRWITKGENSTLRNLQYDYTNRKPQERFRFVKMKDGRMLSIKNYCKEKKLVYNSFRSKLKGLPNIINEI
jgi:hypothetical protein